MRAGIFFADWPWFSLEEQIELAVLADGLGLDSVFEPLERGLARADRNRSDIDVAAALALAIDDDLSAARDAVRAWLAFYLGAMGSREKNFYVELAGLEACGVDTLVAVPLSRDRPRLVRTPAEAFGG